MKTKIVWDDIEELLENASENRLRRIFNFIFDDGGYVWLSRSSVMIGLEFGLDPIKGGFVNSIRSLAKDLTERYSYCNASWNEEKVNQVKTMRTKNLIQTIHAMENATKILKEFLSKNLTEK